MYQSSEWEMADFQQQRIMEDLGAGGWSDLSYNNMQNGRPQRETVGRRNNEEIPVEVESQDCS